MAKIFFSMAGEGRGHATRVRAVAEQLRREHSVVLFASACALDLLATAYAGVVNVEVRPIPGLQFAYKNGRLNYFQSVLGSAPFVTRINRYILALARKIEEDQPDLIITDFEPLLPRAAKRCGAPFVSFDHQHFLSTYDLSSLPKPLRRKAWWMGRFVDAFYSGQQHSIVSSFYFPPLREGVRDVTQVGVLLRPQIMKIRPVSCDHVLVYLRRFVGDNLLDALRNCGREVRIHGLGELPRDGNLHYFPVNEESFLDNLVSCQALVSNAGNQLVGEALYLRKPVFALPETGNFEQQINAHFIRQSGGGDWFDADSVTPADLLNFLEKVPALRRQIDPTNICGNADALAALQKFLPRPMITSQPTSLVA